LLKKRQEVKQTVIIIILCGMKSSMLTLGSTVLGTRLPRWLSSVWGHLIFAGTQNGTCCMSPFLAPIILRWLLHM